jgi:hypothetical protein
MGRASCGANAAGRIICGTCPIDVAVSAFNQTRRTTLRYETVHCYALWQPVPVYVGSLNGNAS